MPRRKKENQSRSALSTNKDKPQQRYAANARERARMRVLSRAFCRLKTTLPWVPADTKLSKLDTLRLAASYIAHLKGILRDETLGPSESSLHPAMSLTWPFGFNRPLGGSAGGGDGSLQGSDLEDMDEEEEDNYDYDGESISSCTWEEVSPRPKLQKECIHLDKNEEKGNTNSRRSSQGRTRGSSKRSNNNNSSSTHNQVQLRKTKKESSLSLSSPLNKQTSAEQNVHHHSNPNPPQPQHSLTSRPLSQSHHHPHQLKLELLPVSSQEHFQTESNNNNVLYHHHHHPHPQEIMDGDKLCPGPDLNQLSLSAQTQIMTVTNLENAPPQQQQFIQSHNNDILVGVGMNNDGFVEDGGFQSHNNHLHHHQQHEIHATHHPHHHHHHIGQGSNPFGFDGSGSGGGNDLISLG